MNGLNTIFSQAADAYEAYRPGYPQGLYDLIFAHCRLNAQSRAMEVGIGTGQATEPILSTGCSVIALEPGFKTWETVTAKYKNKDRLRVLNLSFEDYAGPGNFDLVYAASSFHWVPEEIGYPKVKTLLRSGGIFARFANHPYGDLGRPELDAEVQALYAKHMPGNPRPPIYSQRQADNRASLAEKYGLENLGAFLFRRRRDLSGPEYVGLLGTYSDQLAMPNERRKAFHDEILEAVAAHGGTISLYDTLDLQLARKN